MADSTNINSMESIMVQLRTYGSVIKYAAMGCLLVGGWYTAKQAATPAQPAAQPVGQFIAGSVPVGFNPAVPQAAPSAPATTQTVTFTVASVGRNKTRTVSYLNSQQNFKQAGNQSIQLTGAASSMTVETLVGRTVSATGVVNQYGAIVVSDPAGIQIR